VVNGQFNNSGSADENKKRKYHYSNLFLCQKKISRVYIMQLESILDIYLCALNLQLPSTYSKSPLALIPLALIFHVSFKVCAQL
jgi:hypothetical protein